MTDAVHALIDAAPKAELHLHIEGTLEPSMMLSLAERHGAALPWDTLDAIERAYEFENLQSFLDLYYLGASVLREAEDFHALTAHAGEEGPPTYISGALDALGVERIDHGVRCLDDDSVVARLVQQQIPLTVCPQSNVRLRVVETMSEHPILEMLERGLRVTVNSDDPAYFGGHLIDNYRLLHTEASMSHEQAAQLIRNGLEAAWLADERRQELLLELETIVHSE